MKKGTLIGICLLWLLGAHAQQIDVQHYGFDLTVNDSTNRIFGKATITAKYLEPATSLKLDLAGMKVTRVSGLKFRQDTSALYIDVNAKKGDTATYTIEYNGIPTDGLIISKNKFKHRTFFTDHWPDRAHRWIPCIDHPADKASVTFTVTAPDHYTVIANGTKISETQLSNHRKRTIYNEKVPLPVKVMAVGIADFAVTQSGQVGNIPVYSYLYPEDKVRGFRDYAKAVKILPYFIEQVGPFQFEKLANVQSTTIFGGMENAGAIFYTEQSPGLNQIESLLAHEIAHQWFGDAVTESDWRHLWLSEGFATYMTHLYMEHTYGADTLKAGLKKDRNKIIDFAKRRQTPVVDTTMHDNYMQLLNPNSYEKGSWVLHMLRRQIGDTLFWKGIRQYFKDYNGLNANTEDFRKEMEAASGQDLKPFFQQWLYSAVIPELKVAVLGYDEKAHLLKLEVIQQQEPLMEFPFEYTLDKTKPAQKTLIKEKVTTISIPSANSPRDIWLDPNVNLLADIGG